MKVLFVSRSKSGGAGIAAWRLKSEIEKTSSEVKIDWLDINNLKSNNAKINLIKKVALKIVDFYLNQKFSAPKIPLNFQYEKVSSILGPLKKVTKNYDIIHFHWIADMVNLPVFLNLNKVPIVWTFHDINAISGCFHLKDDETRCSSKIWIVYNQRLKKFKEDLYKSSRSIKAVISPSRSLLDLARTSNMFKNIQYNHIYNIVPLESSLNVPLEHNNLDDSIRLLFVANKLCSYNKGFERLVKVFDRPEIKNQNITLLAIGKVDSSYFLDNEKIRLIGELVDEEELLKYYRISQALIIPSIDENMPNVMLESLLCGTPVLGSNVGGISEEIFDGINGYLFNPMDEESIANTILKFCDNYKNFNDNKSKISDDIKNKLDKNRIVKQHINLYKQITKK